LGLNKGKLLCEKGLHKSPKNIQKNGIDDILMQKYIDGIELSCGCLEKKDGKFMPLPPIEIRPKSSFFDYSSKYEVGGS